MYQLTSTDLVSWPAHVPVPHAFFLQLLLSGLEVSLDAAAADTSAEASHNPDEQFELLLRLIKVVILCVIFSLSRSSLSQLSFAPRHLTSPHLLFLRSSSSLPRVLRVYSRSFPSIHLRASLALLMLFISFLFLCVFSFLWTHSNSPLFSVLLPPGLVPRSLRRQGARLCRPAHSSGASFVY